MGTPCLADPRIFLRVGITPTKKTPLGVQALFMVRTMTAELPIFAKPTSEQMAADYVISIPMARTSWLRLLWAADILCQFLSMVPSFPVDSLARIRHSVKLLHLALEK